MITVVDEPPPSPDVWIDERLTVAESPIEGSGLFFSTNLSADTVVLRLGGRLVSTEQLAALIEAADDDPDRPYVDAVTVYQDQHLVLPPGTPVHFGNHSCEPTLWHLGPYQLATRRPVTLGEEATIDYGTQSGAPGFRMVCRCGAVACRGVITSDDWRQPHLQARYRGHWVPALAARIRAGDSDA